MPQSTTYENCTDCPYHRVIKDPDPEDWFNDDDQAIVCGKTPNPERDLSSRHKADHSEFRPVAVAIRPYNLHKEGDAPSWCPLKSKQEAQTVAA